MLYTEKRGKALGGGIKKMGAGDLFKCRALVLNKKAEPYRLRFELNIRR